MSTPSGRPAQSPLPLEMPADMEPVYTNLARISHSPAELVFDQGFGDLFVIRVAGNIVVAWIITMPAAALIAALAYWAGLLIM